MPLKTILPFFQHYSMVPTFVKCFSSPCGTITERLRWERARGGHLVRPLLRQGHPQQDAQDQGGGLARPCHSLRALPTPSPPSGTSRDPSPSHPAHSLPLPAAPASHHLGTPHPGQPHAPSGRGPGQTPPGSAGGGCSTTTTTTTTSPPGPGPSAPSRTCAALCFSRAMSSHTSHAPTGWAAPPLRLRFIPGSGRAPGRRPQG